MYSTIRFTDLASWTGGHIQGAADQNPLITALCSDTRTLKKGEVYIALKGENFDGHHFLAEAAASGASALIVEGTDKINPALPCLVVSDTLRAWVRIAEVLRDRFKGPVIGITGSAGKSSTKEMVAKLLGPNTVASPASFNNLLGVSKTLSLLQDGTKNLVLELGMNAEGEIREMCQYFKPQFALITNIGDAHLGKVGGPQGVYRAKKELFDYVSSLGAKAGGVALNVEDPRVQQAWREAFPQGIKTIRYSGNPAIKAEVHIQRKGLHPQTGFLQVELLVDQTVLPIELPLFGIHHAQNIAAASAAALLLGVSSLQLQERFQLIEAASHRGQVHKLSNGRVLIDECYNSNPTALISALESLDLLDPVLPRVLVIGDMRELGQFSAPQHHRVGQRLLEIFGERAFTLIGVGEEMRAVVHQVKKANHHAKAWAFPTADAALPALEEHFPPHSVCLVKGSRGIKLDKIVDALLKP